MKFQHTIKFIFFLIIFLSPATKANEIDRINNSLHVIGSLAIGSMAQGYFNDTLISFSSCMGVGILKETIDYYDGNPDTYADMNDIYWNLLGCGLGVVTVKGLQIISKKESVMINYEYKF